MNLTHLPIVDFDNWVCVLCYYSMLLRADYRTGVGSITYQLVTLIGNQIFFLSRSRRQVTTDNAKQSRLVIWGSCSSVGETAVYELKGQGLVWLSTGNKSLTSHLSFAVTLPPTFSRHSSPAHRHATVMLSFCCLKMWQVDIQITRWPLKKIKRQQTGIRRLSENVIVLFLTS